jgi:hypothetical protein
VPLLLSILLVLSGGPSEPAQFYDWYSQAAHALFCGPIHFLVSAFSSYEPPVQFRLSIILRVLTIVPFVAFVPNQIEMAKSNFVFNVVTTVAIAVIGFLFLVLSGV